MLHEVTVAFIQLECTMLWKHNNLSLNLYSRVANKGYVLPLIHGNSRISWKIYYYSIGQVKGFLEVSRIHCEYAEWITKCTHMHMCMYIYTHTQK